jgi:threonyl-tRNA synthetase
VLPERFGLTFRGADGADHRPVMIHRALLGSLERFMGVLIEHYAGAFPVWLAPVQVVLLPITDVQVEYARSIASQLSGAGFRVEIDDSNERLQKKIRNQQLQKVPYMLVVGKTEVADGTVNVRARSGDQQTMAVKDFMSKLSAEVAALK